MKRMSLGKARKILGVKNIRKLDPVEFKKRIFEHKLNAKKGPEAAAAAEKAVNRLNEAKRVLEAPTPYRDAAKLVGNRLGRDALSSAALQAALGKRNTRSQRTLTHAGRGAVAGHFAGWLAGKPLAGNLAGAAIGGLHGNLTHKGNSRVSAKDALKEYKRRHGTTESNTDRVLQGAPQRMAKKMLLSSIFSGIRRKNPVVGGAVSGVRGLTDLAGAAGVAKLQDHLEKKRFKGMSKRQLEEIISKSKVNSGKLEKFKNRKRQ